MVTTTSISEGEPDSHQCDLCPSPGEGRHRVRRLKVPWVFRAVGLDRYHSSVEHLFFAASGAGAGAGERNVVRVRLKGKDWDKLHQSQDDKERGDVYEKEHEHEHLVGGYRYKHKHGKVFKLHSHHEFDPEFNPEQQQQSSEGQGGGGYDDTRGSGNGNGNGNGNGKGKQLGSAKGALLGVLIMSGVLSLVGGASLLVRMFGTFGTTKDVEKMNKRIQMGLKVVGPSFLFTGLSFVVIASSYFVVLRFANRKGKHLQQQGQQDDEKKHPLLGSSSSGDGTRGRNSNTFGSHFYLMCLSHTLSAWEDRMWQFAIPILMMHVFKDTLLPGALFGLVQYLGVVVLMPKAGHVIDRAYRLRLLWYTIMIENFCILGTCVALAFMVAFNQNSGGGFHLNASMIALYLVLLVLGVIGEVCNKMQTISLEQDWVVVMTGQDSELLSRTNVILKRIDLLCKVLAPGVIGIFLDLFGSDRLSSSFVGIVVLGLWNFCSWPIEYTVLREVYEGIPDLQKKKIVNEDEFYQNLLADHEADPSNDGKSVVNSVKEYLQHPVFLASLSFCMLFMTVLDNGTLITSYLTWRSVNASILGIQRGMGAVVGLAGTFAFMHLTSKGGVEKVGLASIWLFALTMAPSVVILLLFGENRTSDYALIGGMIFSRAALWIFDLAERQLMQERVEESSRGVMNSMQVATYQTLYCVIQVCGMIFSDPSQFLILAIISLAGLLLAAAVYTLWFFMQRKNDTSESYSIYSSLVSGDNS